MQVWMCRRWMHSVHEDGYTACMRWIHCVHEDGYTARMICDKRPIYASFLVYGIMKRVYFPYFSVFGSLSLSLSGTGYYRRSMMTTQHTNQRDATKKPSSKNKSANKAINGTKQALLVILHSLKWLFLVACLGGVTVFGVLTVCFRPRQRRPPPLARGNHHSSLPKQRDRLHLLPG